MPDSEAQIIADLLAFIAADRAPDGCAASVDAQEAVAQEAVAEEAAFGALALRVFAYQFSNNIPYQRFAAQRGRTLRTVRHWRDIPAVPTHRLQGRHLVLHPARGGCAGVHDQRHHEKREGPQLSFHPRGL